MRRLIMFACTAVCSLAFANVAAVQCENNIPPNNPDSVYEDDGDGTVTDIRTELTWKKCSEGQSWNGTICSGSVSSHNWADALNRGLSTSYAGFSDWRLPSINELESLIENCASYPTINIDVFPNTPATMFWSGSPYVGGSDLAWYLGFYYGHSNYSYRHFELSVRLVRGGQ